MTDTESQTVADGKRAPVQGFSAGIPWEMHLRAYDAYCKRHGAQPALIDLEGRNCRGGFGTGELDMFIPGWRDELSELARLRATVEELRDALETVDGWLVCYPLMDRDDVDKGFSAMHKIVNTALTNAKEGVEQDTPEPGETE